MKKITTILAAAALVITATSSDFAPLFPFQPTHAAPDNLTNVRTWKGSLQGSAGDQGFILPSGDVFVDEQGRERRFLGTNICFTGCFPEKADAEKVAEELSRYGMNIVRLHYVHHKAPADGYNEKDSFIEPGQLDRFDYLLYQLKKNGIYTYFQLNISRHFTEDNGIENADKLWWNRIGVDNEDSRMIALQKKYHHDILNHVNPYTGLAYKDEPAITMLELANENSILYTWFVTKYNFSKLCEPYASQIKEKWNIWLKEKYGNTETIRKAWMDGLKGDGKEYLPAGKITASSDSYWSIQNDKQSDGDFEVHKADKKDKLNSKYFLRVNVTKAGTSKHIPQFYSQGIHFKENEPYTLKFKIRADKNTDLRVRFSQNHAPYSVAGLSEKVSCGPEWKEITLYFTSNMEDDGVRIVFSNMHKAVYDISDISLKSGIEYEWPKTCSVENGNIDWPYPSEWSQLPRRAIDFTVFLETVEDKYFSDIYDNVKNNIGARQAVTGSQLQFGFDLPQARMDYCDFHSYWNHPAFPGRAWDQTNWNLTNTALVNGESIPGTNILNMGRNRILGKPLTVSEYDHANLNRYSAEGDIIISAFGAFQNWSAIMQFAWTHDTRFFRYELEPKFDMCSATHKLVHFPACYAMFVRGDVKKGDDSIIYTTHSDVEGDAAKMAKARSVKGPAQAKNALMQAVAMNMVSGKRVKELPGLFDGEGKNLVSCEEEIPDELRKAFNNKQIKSKTGEITWNWQKKGAGYFIADSPNTKAFTGFVSGRRFRFDGFTLSPGKTRLDWITFTLTNTEPCAETLSSGRLGKGKYLLAITGVCENTDEKIVNLHGNRISCAQKNGGSKGVAPVLCEGIPANISFDGLSGCLECYALDENGDRKTEIKAKNANGAAEIELGPEYQTVWYEIIVK